MLNYTFKQLFENIPETNNPILWDKFIQDWSSIVEIQERQFIRITPELFKAESIKTRQEILMDPSWQPTPSEVRLIELDYETKTKWELSGFVSESDVNPDMYLSKRALIIDISNLEDGVGISKIVLVPDATRNNVMITNQ